MFRYWGTIFPFHMGFIAKITNDWSSESHIAFCTQLIVFSSVMLWKLRAQCFNCHRRLCLIQFWPLLIQFQSKLLLEQLANLIFIELSLLFKILLFNSICPSPAKTTITRNGIRDLPQQLDFSSWKEHFRPIEVYRPCCKIDKYLQLYITKKTSWRTMHYACWRKWFVVVHVSMPMWLDDMKWPLPFPNFCILLNLTEIRQGLSWYSVSVKFEAHIVYKSDNLAVERFY